MVNSLQGLFTRANALLCTLQQPLVDIGLLPNDAIILPATPAAATTSQAKAISPDSANTAFVPINPLTNGPTCPIDGPVSCQSLEQPGTPPSLSDQCCHVHPGGRLLLTQFWDTDLEESTAADEGSREFDWTLHGLWPDLCDGSYDQYCGMAPRFNNITEVLEKYDQDELRKLMDRYWIAKYGGNPHLWAHEYNKHATCINTLSPTCYGTSYIPGLEVVDYFTIAMQLFRSLDTYRALHSAGIEPDDNKTYQLDDIQAALEKFSGGRVILKCSGGSGRHGRADELHEVWYVYFVKGSLQGGVFVPAKDSFKGDHGNCPSKVRYLTKKVKGRAGVKGVKGDENVDL